MPRLKLTLQYDGTRYAGWQVQANGRSVQATLQDACAQIQLGRPAVTGASRTDAGVHAIGQVCHVDLAGATVDARQMLRSLNGVLPRDVRVHAIERVADDFHARYSATAKAYRYLIARGPAPPLLRHCAWERHGRLKPEPMEAAAAALRGEHDFAAFQAAGSSVADTVRTVYDATLQPIALPGLCEDAGRIIAFDICGNGFLYKMVRTLAGTLVDIGAGRLGADAIERALASRARADVGQTAPAHGLTLRWVRYDPGPFACADTGAGPAAPPR